MSNKRTISEILVSLLKACAYVLAFYFSQVVLGIVLALFVPSANDDLITSRAMELSIIANLLAVVFCILLMRYVEKKSATEGFDMHLDFKRPVTVLALCVAIGVFGQYIVAFLLNNLTFPEAWTEALRENNEAIRSSRFSVTIVALAIVAPLAEEIIFRACLQGTLARSMNKWIAIAISSLVFGIAHGNALSIITATLLGVLLGWLYAQFKSIFPSMLFHLAYNLTSMLLSRLNVVIFIISCICFALGVGYLIYLSISKKGENNEAL